MSEEMDLWLRGMSLPYALLRVALGLNICLRGVVRWTSGLRTFAQSLLPMFQKTVLPVWAVYGFGYALPVVEALVGACILLGFQTRRALIFGSVLMLILTFGSTLRQDWQTVGIQLTYSFIYSVLLAGGRFNSYSDLWEVLPTVRCQAIFALIIDEQAGIG
jgi:thiosulfate dehydrogenase (quinone) large subunit